jgi:hypothetical protein
MKRLGILMLTVFWGCGAQPHPPSDEMPPVTEPAASSSIDPSHGGAMAHGDHQPHYGGIVLMNGDLHFEVVVSPKGAYHVYFSDELRRELPASTVSEVVLTITREHAAPETLILNVDDTGESWVATGKPVGEPQVTIRVAYFFEQKPYWIDIPWMQPVTAGNAVAA